MKQKYSAAEGKALRETGKKWLSRIEAAGKLEQNWMDDAAVATGIYTGEGSKVEVSAAANGVAYDFNILYSNVDTIVPAVINSPPAPDIRRRFGADDPVAKDLAEILERVIRVQVDDGKLQTEMEAMAQDSFLAGRGLIRVRFKSDFVGGETTAEELKEAVEREKPDYAKDDEAEAAQVEQTANECIPTEAVSWKDYRHGPAKRWADRPWEAFRHSIQCEEYDDFADSALLGCQHDPSDPERDADADVTVWEVWDKKSKTVLFIDAVAGKVLKQVKDPLGLANFFPITTPMQPVEINGRLMPVNPFSLYRALADELDITTKRIRIITKQLKLKGWYGGSATDMQAVLDADDNEFTPIADAELWAAKGGIEQAIAFWPVEKLVAVLQQLVGNREQTKQAIYEITGISDIVRGASNSNETATAQQIKTQWGSLRIQKMVRGMERAAREIFIMMAEIIMTKFSPETIQKITGIQVAPTEQDMIPVVPQLAPDMAPEQAQQAQQEAAQAEQARQAKLQHLAQLQALMKEKIGAYYRIDVETDSTVRADLTRQKEEATGFMQAASGYWTAMAPLVKEGTLPIELATEMFASFARMFNLGKSAEDAIDQTIAMAKEKAGQPPPPDPAQAAAAAAAEEKQQASALKQQEAQSKANALMIEGQIKQSQSQADIDRKAAEQRTKNEIDLMKARDESDRSRLEIDAKRIELNIKETELQIKQTDLVLKQREAMQPVINPGGFGNG